MTEINFRVIEALRQRVLLRGEDMAWLFKVSRMTYYSWVTGKTGIRPRNAVNVRRGLRELMDLIARGEWPTPEAVAADPPRRRELLEQKIKRG